MYTTHASLLERLRRPGDQEVWARFVELYTPLLYYWARGLRLQEQDAADLVQEVFGVLLLKLPGFTYDPARTFRGWLRTLLHNRYRTRHRHRTVPLMGDQGADLPGPDDLDDLVEQEYRQYLVGRALKVMRTDFQPATWKACWECVACGRPAAEVADELGMTIKAVYQAKARVLRRLRQELEGLLD